MGQADGPRPEVVLGLKANQPAAGSALWARAVAGSSPNPQTSKHFAEANMASSF
jgi:hypothetical protein